MNREIKKGDKVKYTGVAIDNTLIYTVKEVYLRAKAVTFEEVDIGSFSLSNVVLLSESEHKNFSAIEPAHYRKGQIDLIESWYLRYPFNEFKTGMVMYADRYFNRSKNNRVEDMKKGLYVMQRLKEYEELEKEKENDSDY